MNFRARIGRNNVGGFEMVSKNIVLLGKKMRELLGC